MPEVISNIELLLTLSLSPYLWLITFQRIPHIDVSALTNIQPSTTM